MGHLVLVVEDNPVYAKSLINSGYDALITPSQGEVLMLWPKPGFHAVVMDKYNFPEWLELLIQLRERKYQGIMVLMGMDQADESLILKRKDLGLTACINNRLGPFELAQLIEELIEFDTAKAPIFAAPIIYN